MKQVSLSWMLHVVVGFILHTSIHWLFYISNTHEKLCINSTSFLHEVKSLWEKSNKKMQYAPVVDVFRTY